jgi:hypothetical protein
MSSDPEVVIVETKTPSSMERGGSLERGASLPRTMTANQVKTALSTSGDNPLSGADADLLDLLEQWDVNGDGQYSVEEVLLIARHFRQKQQLVTSLKRTLFVGFLFTCALLVGTLFVNLKANQMTKDMRPDTAGILTTNNGQVAGVAQVMRRGDLGTIPNMTNNQLAELQFVAFDMDQDHYMLKVAGAVRRHTAVRHENELQPTVDLFFVNGPFAKMRLGHNIEVVHPNGTTAIVASASEGEQRRLQSWMHISSQQTGVVGLSGLAETNVQVANSWSHIGPR